MGLLTTLIKAFRYVFSYFTIYAYKLRVKLWKWQGKITDVNAKKVESVLDSAKHIKNSKLKELLKTELKVGWARLLGKLGKSDIGMTLLKKLTDTVIAIAISEYIITEWYNRYISDVGKNTINGALPPDLAIENLERITEELIIMGQFTDSDEFMELFYEGLSNAIGEILEKQMVGALSITTALRYGSESADADDISEACEFRFVSDKNLDYELLLSGAYNSTASVIKAKGRGRVLEQMTSVIHNDILYHNMKIWETYSYPADLIADQLRAIYKNLLIDTGDQLDSAISKYQTQIINAYSVLTAMIKDIEDYTDDEWSGFKPKTYQSYEKQINRYVEKIKQIYDLEVLQIAQQWDDGIEKANQILTDLINVHNTERAKILNEFINAEQFIYGIIMNTLIKGDENIKTVREGGNLTDYDYFKNNLLE